MSLRSIVLLSVVTPLVVFTRSLPAAGQATELPAAQAQIQQMMSRRGGRGAVDEATAEDAALENKIVELVGTLPVGEPGDAPTAAAVNVRRNVAELLEKQFSLRQQRHLREVAEIAGRAKRLREALDKRAAAKRQIVDRRLDDLFGDAEGLGWEGVGGTPRLFRTAAAALRNAAGGSDYAAAMARAMAGGGMAMNEDQARFAAVVNAQNRVSPPSDELSLKDQELASKLEALSNTLAGEDGGPSAEAIAQTRKTAVAILEEQFDLHQQRRLKEIVDTEKQAQALRETIKRRADAKPKIIERRLNELFADVDGLAWDSTDSPTIRWAIPFSGGVGRREAGGRAAAPAAGRRGGRAADE